MSQGGRREGAGRKSKAEELGLARLLDKAWPVEQRLKFFSSLAKLAENPRTPQGMEAGKLLAAYTYGKPKEHLEHSGSNGGPITLRVIYEEGESNANGV